VRIIRALDVKLSPAQIRRLEAASLERRKPKPPVQPEGGQPRTHSE
jgi:hypothetical protein